MSAGHTNAPWTRPETIVVVVLAMLMIAAGHLLLITEFTTFYLGVPAWLWIHLVVVLFLLSLAWLLVEYVLAGEGS